MEPSKLPLPNDTMVIMRREHFKYLNSVKALDSVRLESVALALPAVLLLFFDLEIRCESYVKDFNFFFVEDLL